MITTIDSLSVSDKFALIYLYNQSRNLLVNKNQVKIDITKQIKSLISNRYIKKHRNKYIINYEMIKSGVN